MGAGDLLRAGEQTSAAWAGVPAGFLWGNSDSWRLEIPEAGASKYEETPSPFQATHLRSGQTPASPASKLVMMNSMDFKIPSAKSGWLCDPTSTPYHVGTDLPGVPVACCTLVDPQE
jgi:hypothetical protein